jgi:hypothetical protein
MVLGLLEFCCESTSFWWLQNLSIFREWDQQQPSMGLWLELWLCENQCRVHHIRDHGDFINSCTDVQEGEIMTKISRFSNTDVKPNPSISSFESPYVFFNNLAISLYYLLFWIYQHSQENLTTTPKLFRNTSPHTFALWTPLKRASPTNRTQRRKDFVLFCFGNVMMAIDGIPSQTIAPRIIQNPIPSKTKRDPKDGSELHDVGGSWENEKGNGKITLREFLEACIIDSFLHFITSFL